MKEEKLWELVRRAYPYRNLTQVEFEQLLEMLSEGVSTRRGGGARIFTGTGFTAWYALGAARAYRDYEWRRDSGHRGLRCHSISRRDSGRQSE